MRSPIHAVPAESSAGHRGDRRCPCGAKPYRDLNTGRLDLWVHRQPPPAPPGPRERQAQRDFERFAAAPWIEREDRTDG